ncbi:hypothetical protein [Paludisphaera sp.]|uniref:hypothetical protein n=1 Tax=Paludisphaera sp. TaxID=2017432 RepID=UPI00301C3B35
MRIIVPTLGFGALLSPARGDGVLFATGDPDGLMAMASRPSGGGGGEIETGDDFVLDGASRITGLSFTGLLTGGATPADIAQIVVEIYRVFPEDSTVPPSGSVPTRANSPSDVALTSRDSGAGELTYASAVVNPSFAVGNSVLNGIHPVPGNVTGGDGPVVGSEVRLDIALSDPITLAAGRYFLVPQVLLAGAGQEFYWLSAPRLVGPPVPDLQTWIRDGSIDPDWLRVGTDIEGQGRAFNASFTLTGTAVPEPAAVLLAGIAAAAGCGGLPWSGRRRPGDRPAG